MTQEPATPQEHSDRALRLDNGRSSKETNSAVRGPQPEPIREQMRDFVELVEALLAPL